MMQSWALWIKWCIWVDCVIIQYRLVTFTVEALWLSGRVLDSRSRGCRFEPHQRHCIVSLSKTCYPLLSTGSTQEDLSRHDWTIVDWDVKNQIKQTFNVKNHILMYQWWSQRILTDHLFYLRVYQMLIQISILTCLILFLWLHLNICPIIWDFGTYCI